MTLVVEEDKPFDPVDIGFLGSRTIVPDTDRVADLFEQLGLLRRRRRVNAAIRGVAPRSMEEVGLRAFTFGSAIRTVLATQLKSCRNPYSNPYRASSAFLDESAGKADSAPHSVVTPPPRGGRNRFNV